MNTAWTFVIVISGLGLLLLVVSMAAPAIQQAAVGSMVTAFVVCTAAIALAVTNMKRS
jgi:hypothetical protein